YFAHHGANVLAVDLPGHGRSDGNALASVRAIADWIVALLDAASVARAALVGHSMGSLAALDAAGRYPQRMTRLALLAPSVPMPVARNTQSLIAALGDKRVITIPGCGHSLMTEAPDVVLDALRSFLAPPPPPNAIGATR